MITAEERKAICEAREFNDKLLQGIADYTVCLLYTSRCV